MGDGDLRVALVAVHLHVRRVRDLIEGEVHVGTTRLGAAELQHGRRCWAHQRKAQGRNRHPGAEQPQPGETLRPPLPLVHGLNARIWTG